MRLATAYVAVFTSSFWIISFLPSVTTPLVAKYHAAGNREAAEDTICQGERRELISGVLTNEHSKLEEGWSDEMTSLVGFSREIEFVAYAPRLRRRYTTRSEATSINERTFSLTFSLTF